MVTSGRIVTGAGVSAGIDLALTLAAKIAGPEVAQSYSACDRIRSAAPIRRRRPVERRQNRSTTWRLRPSATDQPSTGKRRWRPNRSSAVCITARTWASTSSTSGSSPNWAMMIGSRTSVTILDGNGRLTGIVDVRPKGKPMVNGRISNRMRLRPNRLASQAPRVRKSWVS